MSSLLDVHVGKGDGRDLLDELRAADSAVRVLMLTGSVEPTGGRFAAADRVVDEAVRARPARGGCSRAGRPRSCRFDYVSVTASGPPKSSRPSSSATSTSAPRRGARCGSGRRRPPSRRRSSRATRTSSSASRSTRCAGRRRRPPGDEAERLYRLRKTCESGIVSAELAEREDELENALLAARVQWQGEELPLRAAQAKLAVLPDYREREELGEPAGAPLSRVQRRPPRADHRRRRARGRALGRARCGRAKRGGEGDLAARPRARARRRERAWTTRGSACARSGSSACSGRTATTCRRRRTSRGSVGCLRSSRRTPRSAPSRSAWTRSTRLGFDLQNDPNVRLDLEDRPQKSPRACVIASDPPTVVHLITRAQGGLHDYQAFMHEAGHALHYAGVDPVSRTRSARSRATTR